MDDLPAMARLLEALRPWLTNLVIVGGWAHRLHRYHPLANPPAFLPVVTRDADMALSPLPMRGDMAAALIAAGFEQELSGEDTPPASRYWLGGRGVGFYAEFLAPLTGSGVKRNGTPDSTLRKAGITAQKLRYVDLLLERPLVVSLGNEIDFPIEPAAEIHIANPVSFIAQKLLIYAFRPPAKRAQDVLYVHDTVELFAAGLDELRLIWREDIRPAVTPGTARKIESLAREQFVEVTEEVRVAARIPQNRSLRPDRVRAVCEQGLDAIFGRG